MIGNQPTSAELLVYCDRNGQPVLRYTANGQHVWLRGPGTIATALLSLAHHTTQWAVECSAAKEEATP